MSMTVQSLRSVPHRVEIPDRIPSRRYYDQEFFDMEREYLWPHVWQMACRLEEIPNPGDYSVYDILDKSVVVVRTEDGSVNAFHNACAHRGVTLCEGEGNCGDRLVCPFHGWRWDLEGTNKFVFQKQLFSDTNLDPKDLQLTPVRVELWGGSAFINFDDDAPPLRASLEPFATFHDALNVEQMRAQWWYSARLPVNWKLGMEAFMEGYHVMATHPQLTGNAPHTRVHYEPGFGAGGTRVRPPKDQRLTSREFIEANIASMQTLYEGMASMILPKDIEMAKTLLDASLPDDPLLAAAAFGDLLARTITTKSHEKGVPMPDLTKVSPYGVNSVNYCFPHFFLLPVFGNAASYRFRPIGPEECLMEIWSLTLCAPGEEPEAPKRPEPMALDDPRWPSIPAQDFGNLPRQQRGLHQDSFEYMRLSEQIEGQISNYNRLIDGYLSGVPREALLQAVRHVSGPIDDVIKDLGFGM